MVTMVTKNKRYLINFTFYETFKDKPIPHKDFMFLGQGSYEITRGFARPPTPWYPMWSKTLGIQNPKPSNGQAISANISAQEGGFPPPVFKS